MLRQRNVALVSRICMIKHRLTEEPGENCGLQEISRLATLCVEKLQPME